MKLLPTVAALGLLAATGATHAADPNLARNLAATCANCHGTNGNAVKGGGIDALAGVPKDKILQKLADLGLLSLNEHSLQVTPKGRFLIRNIAMVFDYHLRHRETQATYSKTV